MATTQISKVSELITQEDATWNAKLVSFHSWLENIIINSTDEVKTHVLSLCFEIRKTHNKHCFEGTPFDPLASANKTWQVALEYSNSVNVLHPLHVSSSNVQTVDHDLDKWCKPPTSWYKVNMDDAGFSDGVWGIGTVIRDKNGKVMTAATWRINDVNDVDLVETLGMKLALNFAIDLGFYSLVAESDSLNVVQAMLSSSTIPTHFGMVVNDCTSLVPQFYRFKVYHVRRSANKVAHCLAKFTLVNVDSIWIEETHLCNVVAVA